MPFSNVAVALSEIPAAGNIVTERISRDYKKVIYWEILVAALILLLTYAGCFYIEGFRRSPLVWIVPLAIVAVLAFAAVVLENEYPRMGFIIRENDVVYKSGWIFQKTIICPYNRVQNCSVSAGPFQRKYGLATIRIYTAGDHGADFHIRGLKTEQAEQIRQFIISKIHQEDES